jgi:hypothetical protein
MSTSGAGQPFWRPPPFDITMAVVILLLSLLYSLVYGHMVYVSVVEQVIPHQHYPLRFEGPSHYHNPIEWALLIGPAVTGWLGTFGSLAYLARRLRRTR